MIYMTYLLNVSYEGLPRDSDFFAAKKNKENQSFHEIYKMRPLVPRAAHDWIVYLGMVEEGYDKPALNKLAIKLLDPHGPHFRNWTEQTKIKMTGHYDIFFPQWTIIPGTEINVWLAYACYYGLVDVAKTLLEQISDDTVFEHKLERAPGEESPEAVSGSLLQIAASAGQVAPIVERLIRKGCNVDVTTDSGSTLLHLALGLDLPFGHYQIDGRLRTVQVLLAANINPNPRFVAETPLQAALRIVQEVYNVDQSDLIKIAEALLQAGADVNGIGDDDAIVARIKYENRDSDDHLAIKKRIHDRGKGHEYDTPLRIVESWGNALADLTNFLTSHGAKSLHRFPIAGLPGYVEEDMMVHL
jgi:hypothetical protein